VESTEVQWKTTPFTALLCYAELPVQQMPGHPRPFKTGGKKNFTEAL